MKSSVFFEAVNLPPSKPPEHDPQHDSEPPNRWRGWVLGVLAVGVILTFGVIFWNLSDARKIDADPVDREPQSTEETDEGTPIFDLSLSPHGDRLYFRNVRGEIRRLNLLEESGDLESNNLFPGRVCELFKISPNNQFMLATFRNDEVLLIDLASSNIASGTHKLLTLNSTESVASFSFSENLQFGAAGTSLGRVFVWDLLNRELVGSFQKKKTEISSLCLSPFNELYVTFGSRLERWKIRPDARKRRLVFDAILDESSTIREMILSREADILVTGQYSGILTGWDVSRAERIWEIERISPASRTLIVSPDREHVTCATIEGELRLYQIRTGIPDALFAAPGMKYVTGAAFSQAGDILYTSSTDGLIRIWSVPGQVQIGSIDPADAVRTSVD